MATFLCKKCAHKTLPISITTFHFQFAVRSFHLFPPMARQSPLLSLGHQKKRETLTGELGFERRPRELRTENWNWESRTWRQCACCCCCSWLFLFLLQRHAPLNSAPTPANCVSLPGYFPLISFFFLPDTTMRDWWKEIHKNVNFSGGNIIYVKRSGQPRGNPPAAAAAAAADSDSDAGSAALVIAVSWIGLVWFGLDGLAIGNAV